LAAAAAQINIHNEALNLGSSSASLKETMDFLCHSVAKLKRNEQRDVSYETSATTCNVCGSNIDNEL